jgi:Flp pilus assembly protein TadB
MGKKLGRNDLARKNKLLKNKKGSAIDLIFIAMGITIFAIVVLFGFKITSVFNDHIQADANIPTEAKDSTTTLLNDYSGVIDNSALFLLVVLAIGAFVMAGLVRVHPMFIPLYIIMLVLIIFFCGVYSNIYQGLAEDPNLAAEANQLVLITWILTYLPFIVGIFGFILMFIMYKLWQNEM